MVLPNEGRDAGPDKKPKIRNQTKIQIKEFT
jgi:hypothetical protein